MTRAFFVGLLLFAGGALACAVCGQGGTPNDPNQGAYKVMTFVMSFMPLVAIGGVGFFVFWQVRKHNAQPLEPPPPPPAGAQPVEALVAETLVAETVPLAQQQNAST